MESSHPHSDDFVSDIINYYPEKDIAFISAAAYFAEEKHVNQKRLSGEPYIIHPLSVARKITDLKLDAEAVAAALLHDVVEDTEVDSSEIESKFGQEVRNLVDGVTKISSLKAKSRESNQAENIRKILIASIRDVRILIIKLADKFHNMKTLQFQSPVKQKIIAQEVLDIYAPLAGRIGMYVIKSELEDLALKFTNEKFYYKIADDLINKKKEREVYINQVIDILNQNIADSGISGRISGRAKHIYSIYNKMKKEGKDISQIYDLHGVRIICKEIRDCYALLGMVHTLWNPVPNRFKDYIATPKPNLYQSIHTTVWGPGMEPLEIQIRTERMNEIAEDGIAAHWQYKENKHQPKLSVLDKINKWSINFTNDSQFLREIKKELSQKEIFVFTPQGKIIELPVGSTPVDFAYHIHTEIGNRCMGAKINGKLVNLHHQLEQGDQIEILTRGNIEPNVSWLKLCQTSLARNKIRSFLRKKSDKQDAQNKQVEVIPEETITKGQERTVPKTLKLKKKNIGDAKNSSAATVSGFSNVLIKFSLCCNPVVGEEIVGYISKGSGIKVHKKNCSNIVNQQLEPDRIIKLVWDRNSDAQKVNISILAYDRDYMLRDIVEELSAMKIPVISTETQKRESGKTVLRLVLFVNHADEIKLISQSLSTIPGVKKVYREIFKEKDN